ncbi:hypothetical protein OHT68_02490 [Streptomyces canus]|uniref:hypothetical protein n=1 Tax=Streptomyces canus TaxID=58343 RepID=UPI002E2C98DE|nr:hypothetical protein [Streptomyces canus]
MELSIKLDTAILMSMGSVEHEWDCQMVERRVPAPERSRVLVSEADAEAVEARLDRGQGHDVCERFLRTGIRQQGSRLTFTAFALIANPLRALGAGDGS